MGVIYTIAHPLTNNIVYVGASSNLFKRASIHISVKSASPISIYIQSLKEQYLLPKIEVIETCDGDELMELEKYWIHQLQSWGFDLLNINKRPGFRLTNFEYKKKTKEPKPPKVRTTNRFIKKTADQWAEERRIRAEIKLANKPVKQNKWNISLFEIGKVYEFVNPDKRDLNSFRTMFGQYAKLLNIERHLVRSEVGETITYTVVDGKNIFLPDYGRTKSGSKRYKPLLPKAEVKVKPPSQIIRYNFSSLNIGDTLTIPLKNKVSFQNSVGQYNRGNNKNICFNYEIVDDCMNIIIVSQSDENRGKALSKELIELITSDNRSTTEIAKHYGLSYSAVWNYKNKPDRRKT